MDYFEMAKCLDYQAGFGKPHYPVPALNIEVVPVFFDCDCIAIDMVNRKDDGPWPVVCSFERKFDA